MGNSKNNDAPKDTLDNQTGCGRIILPPTNSSSITGSEVLRDCIKNVSLICCFCIRMKKLRKIIAENSHKFEYNFCTQKCPSRKFAQFLHAKIRTQFLRAKNVPRKNSQTISARKNVPCKILHAKMSLAKFCTQKPSLAKICTHSYRRGFEKKSQTFAIIARIANISTVAMIRFG
jgi:hypothetical protein